MDKQMLAVGGLPDDQDIIHFRAQYQKAVQGLYEAYRFGCMLQRVKHALEGTAPQNEETLKNQASFGSLTRETAENEHAVISTGKSGIAGGWNAGMGLKGWLSKRCPEINYKTAMRFMDAGRYALEKYRSDGRFLQRSCGLRKDSTENE